MVNENTIDSSQNKWFIHFDPKSGKIFKISGQDTPPINGRISIVTDNKICAEITTGKISKRDLAVYRDLDNETWFVDTRGSTLTLTGKDHWVRLQEKSRGDSEIHVDIYTETKQLEVSVNLKKIKKNFRLREINEIAKNKDNILDLYITRQGDPDFMIKTLKVDALELFIKGRQIFDLDIDQYASLRDISIYTRQVFSEYSMHYRKVKFDTDFNNNLSKTLQTADLDCIGDVIINIGKDKSKIKITSSITNYEKYVTDQKKFLHFIVCSSNIDTIVGGFEVPYDRIIGKKLPYHVKTTFKWPPNPIVVYKNKYIKIGIDEKE